MSRLYGVCALRRRQTPTVLVPDAAVMPTGTPDQSVEEDWAFAVNVKGACLTGREVVPLMRSAGGGSIILMASATGINWICYGLVDW
jgi:NAD(P)-dependent dehydrogenase (short-subunit alcohol dehydrogenase family)